MVQQGRVDYVLEVTLDINGYKIHRPDGNREIYVFSEDIHLDKHKVGTLLHVCFSRDFFSILYFIKL